MDHLSMHVCHSNIKQLFGQPSLFSFRTGHSRCSSLIDLTHHRNASSSSSASCGVTHPSQLPPSNSPELHLQATSTKPERLPPPSAAAPTGPPGSCTHTSAFHKTNMLLHVLPVTDLNLRHVRTSCSCKNSELNPGHVQMCIPGIL